MGGEIGKQDNKKEHPGKLAIYVRATSILAATGGLIFGYDIGISGIYNSFILIKCLIFVLIDIFLENTN